MKKSKTCPPDLLGGVLGLVFVFCIPFTQRHFRKIGVGLSKNCTSTPLKDDELRAQGQRGRSGRPTNRQLEGHEMAAQSSRTGSSITIKCHFAILSLRLIFLSI